MKDLLPRNWNLQAMRSIGLLCFFASANLLSGQSITWNNTVPSNISVCLGTENFDISLTNNSGDTLENLTIRVQLPSGVDYSVGSLTNVTGGSVSEQNVSNTEDITFSASDLLDGATLSFRIAADADMDTYNFVIGGGVLRNTLTATYTGGADTTQTNSYNLYYPALSITTVNSLSASVYAGQTFTRQVTIVNGGYGATTSFTLKDSHDSNVQVIATDVGTLNTSTEEITVSVNDFTAIGDGDGYFDQNESITITQTIKATGCTSTQSTLKAVWGCGSEVNSNIKYPYTTITLYNPSIAVSANANFDVCDVGNAQSQSVTITNSGSGPGVNGTLTITQDPVTAYSRIDTSTIYYSVDGGASTRAYASSVTAASAYSCLGNNPMAAFTISLPDILPGEQITVSWDSYTCATDVCGNINLAGWDYSYSCDNNCGTQSYTKSGQGLSSYSKSFSIFSESPSDLSDGQTGEYVFIISSASVTLPEGNSPYYKLVFDVPDGLSWSGNSADLVFINGTTQWTASSISFDSNTDQLTAQYDFPIPFSLTRAEIRLKLTMDCNVPNVNGSATVGMQLYYVMDGVCSTPYELPLFCQQTVNTYLHCPGTCTEGLAFQGFSVARTSFGDPDNDQDGAADGTGSVDMTKIKLNRVMVNDTFKTVFTGTVKTSGSFPSWSYMYASSTVPYGDTIVALYANLSVTDAGTGQTLTCSSVPLTQSMSGTDRLVNLDLSPAALAAAGCSDFSGFTFGNDDQVTLTVYYKVTGNIGGAITELQITNDFYVSPSANGTAYQCDDWAGNFTLIGYYFSNGSANTVTVKNCTKTVSQNFYMSIGDCCTNYAGGDFFPFEYRHWAYPKNVRVVIPDGYSITNAKVQYYRTEYTNSTLSETVNGLSAYDISGQTYQYDLETLFQNGSLTYGDDGFNGTFTITVDPVCTLEEDTKFSLYWYFTFVESERLGNAETAEYSSSPDKLKYRRGDIQVSTNFQTVDGTGLTASWDVTVTNNKNADGPYAWIFPVSPNGALTITKVEDLTSNTELTAVNGGFYQLGNFSAYDSKDYRITVSYNSCATSELVVYSGHSCDGYPTNLSTFSCSYNSYSLYVEPQPAETQVRIYSNYDANDHCSNVSGVELELLSAKLAAVKDLVVKVIQPNTQSITVVSGSSYKKYPASGSFSAVSDPSYASGTYTYTIASLDSIINADGLVGITNTAANTFRLKFDIQLESNFTPGEYLTIEISSSRNCGDTLATLRLAYDPTALFDQITGVGLTTSTDTWATTWADYDGDGDPDLFITTRDPNQTNELYKNNGDGTFTQITSGSIVTDQASSMAATWGDYDNDGDLDVFVANNIGYANFLYRNEGDGTFTKILNDPIVSDLGYAHGAAWGDYNNDGYLDLFVASFFASRFNLLYKNNGDGTFTLDGNNPIAKEAASSVSGFWADYNDDGWPDLFVANNNGENNLLYKNTGNGNFEKITTGDIVNDGGYSVGASWADYDNDGDLDLFVANSGDHDNFLYRNDGDGTFTKITTGDIVNDGGHSHGSAWADYDNDGWLDLFVANDQDNDNFLYRNKGDGTFTKIENPVTLAGGYSFGSAWADYDLDGDVDLFIVNRNDNSNFLFKNVKGDCNSYLCVKLVGTVSNKAAIGAKVKVKATVNGNAVWQMREISSQTGGGVGAQNELKLIFGLGDASTVDSVVVVWPSGYEQVLTNQSVDQCLTITEDNASEICGTVYYDENGNCTKDSGENGIPNVKITLTPGDIVTYTGNDGTYSVYAKPDTYTITQTPGSNWSMRCPNDQGTRSVSVSGIGQQYCGNDFGNTPSCVLPELNVEVATTAHRIGFHNLLGLAYSNDGATAATGATLKLVLPSARLTPTESTVNWTSTSGDTLIWSLGTLSPGTKGTIYIIYTVDANTAVGDTLQLDAFLNGNESDCNNSNNSYQEISTAVGAFDPNDILVNPEGYIRNDQWLTYKIRFQNVGNQVVNTVRVEDELPATLDLSTLQPGVASHHYQFQTEGRKLIWTFPAINLPDSVSNEPQSHGFAIFRIKPAPGLLPGDEIHNSANIFFDNLEPVKTNTVINTIKAFEDLRYKDIRQLHIYPNPSGRNKATVTFQSGSHLTQNTVLTVVTVYNMAGQPILRLNGIGSRQATLDLSDMIPGNYLVKGVDDAGRLYFGKLQVF